jgi:hypothetical protein
VGFGATAGGSGVGLVNIRRQLAARYGELARLTLEQQAIGVCAQIVLPCQAVAVPNRRPVPSDAPAVRTS